MEKASPVFVVSWTRRGGDLDWRERPWPSPSGAQHKIDPLRI
jgi:hypothetical protein